MADSAMRFIDHIFLCVKLELKCTVILKTLNSPYDELF